jgi:hypothetical protein
MHTALADVAEQDLVSKRSSHMTTAHTADVLHTVLVKWKPGLDTGSVEGVRLLVRGLPHSVPGVLNLCEGPSVSQEGLERGWEYGFAITFASFDDLMSYLPHPAHQELVAQLTGCMEDVLVFDVGGPSTGPGSVPSVAL